MRVQECGMSCSSGVLLELRDGRRAAGKLESTSRGVRMRFLNVDQSDLPVPS